MRLALCVAVVAAAKCIQRLCVYFLAFGGKTRRRRGKSSQTRFPPYSCSLASISGFPPLPSSSAFPSRLSKLFGRFMLDIRGCVGRGLVVNSKIAQPIRPTSPIAESRPRTGRSTRSKTLQNRFDRFDRFDSDPFPVSRLCRVPPNPSFSSRSLLRRPPNYLRYPSDPWFNSVAQIPPNRFDRFDLLGFTQTPLR